MAGNPLFSSVASINSPFDGLQTQAILMPPPQGQLIREAAGPDQQLIQALQDVDLQPFHPRGSSEEIPVEGGRYDVCIHTRRRTPVYWEEEEGGGEGEAEEEGGAEIQKQTHNKRQTTERIWDLIVEEMERLERTEEETEGTERTEEETERTEEEETEWEETEGLE
ncbi:hypothetical protein Pmani_036341 [Petrolisthes manimaculis]|uniref:Uncharacterized protein n=1 Tax=Petrolisthes manimaculis TaxID=1843537 RepID=A0AAE1NIP0_9EUCA|nr:hypothetical protein Pmani_036341 [Petrolisthes manimaculis]